MTRLLLYLAGGLLALALISAIVLGGEPPQPKLAQSGPMLAARFLGTIKRSSEPMRAVAFGPDGTWLASTGVDGAVVVSAVPSGKLIAHFTHPGGATALAVAPDGSRIATAGYDGAVRIWRLRDGLEQHFVVSAKTLWSLAFDPAGTHLAVSGEDAILRLLPVNGAAPVRRFVGHERNVWGLGFSPDGHTLASAGFDRTLRLWDVASGKLLRTVTGHDQGVVALDVRRTDGTIVTGADDGTLRFWRRDGTPLRTLGAGQFVDAVAFSRDGQWLASGGRESHGVNAAYKALFGHRLFGRGVTVRLWRVADGAMVAAIDQQSDDVVALAISPDGRYLASGSEDGTVGLWELTRR